MSSNIKKIRSPWPVCKETGRVCPWLNRSTPTGDRPPEDGLGEFFNTIVLLKECGKWVAQGLEHDICGQGDSPGDALKSFAHYVMGYTILPKENGQKPLEGIGKAPEEYWPRYRTPIPTGDGAGLSDWLLGRLERCKGRLWHNRIISIVRDFESRLKAAFAVATPAKAAELRRYEAIKSAYDNQQWFHLGELLSIWNAAIGDTPTGEGEKCTATLGGRHCMLLAGHEGVHFDGDMMTWGGGTGQDKEVTQ